MDEEEKYWEQPEDLTLSNNEDVPKEEGSQHCENQTVNDDTVGEAEKGETIGKFKSVEALLDAYNNLEKEFTKKSQRLSQLEKDKTVEEENLNEELDKKFHSFLSSNLEAESFGGELKEKVQSDDNLKKMDDPFGYVWAEMIFEKLKNPNQDEKVLNNYILKNESLKNMVIENYVNQLTENKSPIKISSSGKRVGTTVSTQKPETLKDAKKFLLDLLS